MHRQFDELVVLRRSHALLHAGRVTVEAGVDGIAQLRAGHHVLVFGSEHHAQLSRLEADAAAQNSAARQPGAVFLAVGRRIDQDGALGQGQRLAFANLLVEVDGHFLQPAFQQPAAAQAGAFALRQHAHLDVERISLLDSGPHVSADQDDFRIRRTEHLVRILHAPLLHFVQQGGLLSRRRGIAARSFQARHQPDRLDLKRVESHRNGHVAGKSRIGARRLFFRALRAEDRRSGTTGQDAEPAEDQAADRKFDKRTSIKSSRLRLPATSGLASCL